MKNSSPTALLIASGLIAIGLAGSAPTAPSAPDTTCQIEAERYATVIASQIGKEAGFSAVVVASDGDSQLLSSDDTKIVWDVQLQVSETAADWPSHDRYRVALDRVTPTECLFRSVELVDTFL